VLQRSLIWSTCAGKWRKGLSRFPPIANVMAFGVGTKTALASHPGIDGVGLRGRGEQLRRLGEIIVLIGLALLLLWEDAANIAPTLANFRGLVHVPSEVVSYLQSNQSALRRISLQWPGGVRDVSALVELVIALSALSAVVRRRRFAALCHLAFFLFPWPLVGISISIAQIGALGLLIAFMVDAARLNDTKRIAVLGGCVVTSLLWFQGVEMVKQPGPEHLYVALPRDVNKHVLDILAGSDKPLPETQNRPKAGLAYVAAQEAALRDKPEVVIENLAEAADYSFDGAGIEAHRLKSIGVYLAEKKIGRDDQVAASQRMIDAVRFKTQVFMVAALAALVGGTVLQTLAGWIGDRFKRMLRLADQIQNNGARDQRPPPVRVDTQGASLDFTAQVFAALKRRAWITFVAGSSGLALGATFFVASRLFWVPDILNNTAFATIHVLEDFASLNTPVISHETWLRMRDQQFSLWSIVAPALVFLTGLGLLVLRQYRKLLLVGSAYCAWCLYGILTPTISGMVELPVSAMNMSTIAETTATAGNSSKSTGASKAQESIDYTLAQTAYLSNDWLETEARLASLVNSGFRNVNAFEWRYVAMSDWVSQKLGRPVIESRLRPNLALFQTLSNLSLMTAAIVGTLATTSLLLSAILFLRLRKLGEFIKEISIGAALQRSKAVL
jgi:hypothetical protein